MLIACAVFVAVIVVVDRELAKQRLARGLVEQYKRDRRGRR